MGGARCAAAALLALAMLGARQAPPAGAEVADIPPSLVLQRYEEALARVKTPPNLIFEYSVEQSGLRNLEQVHRVYRSGGRERDETLRVDGVALKTPQVRILQTPDRYAVTRLAPKPGDYTFSFTNRSLQSGRTVYTFHTELQRVAPFAITSIDVDAEHFLPVTLHFRSVDGLTKGSGRVSYAPQQSYWLPREASVEAHAPTGKVARERITWAQFGFPEALPSSTFAPTRPADPASP